MAQFARVQIGLSNKCNSASGLRGTAMVKGWLKDDELKASQNVAAVWALRKQECFVAWGLGIKNRGETL